MNLVKIGQLIVNLDQVKCLRDLSQVDNLGQVLQGRIRIEFSADHVLDVAVGAEALRDWLATQVTDLGPSSML